MTPSRFLVIFLLALAALRLVLIGLFELTPDEAYYYLWSQNLDLSYYSKGPGIAATIWAGTHLFGATEFGVRFFSPLLSLATSLIMYRFARRLYGEKIAIWTTLALSCVPIYQAGGLLMTIDPLSMCFWMAALYTAWRALEQSPAYSHWWPATGALIGLGFLCKWINAMQLLSILLFLAVTPKYRRELRRPGFYTMLGAFLPFTAPPVIWNAQHDWITLAHLSARGGLEHAFKIDPSEFFTFLGGQFGVYSPIIYAAMLAAIWFGFGRARVHLKPRFLLAFALPVLAMYFGLSLREAGEANWTAPATLSLGLLAVATFYDLAQEHRWLRRTVIAGLALGAVMSMLTLNLDLLRQARILLPYENDPSARLRGWRTSAQVVDDFRHAFEAKTGTHVFLIGNRYQTSAELAFYLKDRRQEAPGHPPVYIPESQALENQFSFWHRYDEITDLPDIARDYLHSPTADAVLRPRIAEALEAVEKVAKEEKQRSAKMAEARRGLVRELHKAMPDLPLDESYVEEEGVSLFVGHDALFVTDRAEERPPSTIKGGFEKVEMVACVDIQRRGLPLRQLRIFACHNYHSTSL